MKLYNMTAQQNSIWEMIKRFPGSSIGNIGGVIRFNKDMDPRRLYNVLCRLHELNPALTLRVNKDGKLYTADFLDKYIVIVDGAEAEKGEEKLKEWMNTPIFSYDDCLVRYYIMVRHDGVWLYGVFHHIICDGIGLIKVTGEAYELANNPNSPLWNAACPDTFYLEYLEEQETRQGGNINIPEAYLNLIDSEHIVLPKRRISNSPNADILKKRIEGTECEKIVSYSDENKLTPEHIFEAAISIHDSKITGNGWASIGRVMVNRKKKYMNTAGMFTNVLPVIVKVSEGESFLELCQDIKKQEFTMLKCGDLSLKELRDRKQFFGRMYDTCITYRPTKRLPLGHAAYMDEIECDVVEVGLRILIDEQSDGIQLTYKYMTDLYTENEIERLHEELMDEIHKGINADNNNFFSEEQGSSENCAKTEYEKFDCEKTEFKKLGSADDYHEVPDIMELFAQKAKECGDSEFIIDVGLNGLKITYMEAYLKMCKISRHLMSEKKRLNVDEKMRIGLKLSRSFMMPLAILACLDTETIFVPVAIDESKERIELISKQLDFIIDDSWVDEAINEESDDDKQTVKDKSPAVNLDKDTLAYAIHTSGSTGNPKLVEIYRHALNVRLAWMKENFGLDGCKVLQKTRNTFDVSVWELLLPAVCGGTLIMLPNGYEREPEKMWDAVRTYDVDTLHFVPSMLSVCLKWLEQHKNAPKLSVKKVFSSGEVLSPTLVERFYNMLPDTDLYNLYGPAECTIDVTWHECIKGEKITPIGRPVWNTECMVVNQFGNPVPDGYCGELVVIGDLVGRGYAGNEEETNKKFGILNGKRIYYTGDIVYTDDNGEINYVGRKDREIKLRGMRINLSVLEQEAAAIYGVKGAAACRMDNRLALFLVASIEKSKIRSLLSGRIAPHYMPDIICVVDNIPYNKNGKCDYEALCRDYKKTADNKENGKASSDKDSLSDFNKLSISKTEKQRGVESMLLQTLMDIIKDDDHLTSYTSIPELGLDSISIVEWMIKIEKRGIIVRYDDIAGAETIEELAQRLIFDNEKKDILKPIGFDIEDVHDRSKKIAIGVPFAGAGINSFLPLAKEMERYGFEFWACDAAGSNGTVEELAQDVVDFLKDYICGIADEVQIAVIGCCVGAALAVEITGKLKALPGIDSKLVLIGSLPTAFLGNKDKQKLLWDLFSYKIGGYGISILSGHKVSVTKEMYSLVKSEAKRYVYYFENRIGKEKRVSGETIMFFGDKDILTIGYKKRYMDWKKYLSGSVHVIRLKGAFHFCLATHGEQIASELKKYFDD